MLLVGREIIVIILSFLGIPILSMVIWVNFVVYIWLGVCILSVLGASGERPSFSKLERVEDVSLSVAMICRNEAVNFKSNLAEWFGVADSFVFLLDNRNSDNSAEVIQEIMSKGDKKHVIESHVFTGFGQARTKSLEIAWRHFPDATHIMLADPDWRPRVDTLDKSELIRANAEVFRFTVYDRNRVTTRRIDWMLRHREGLAMRYHLHEVLDIGYYSWADTSWTVDEIEQNGTWHNEVGHINSFDAKRYQFDLSMLAKDKAMYAKDAHVDYYLGITHHSYADKLLERLDEGMNTLSDLEKGALIVEADRHLHLAVESLNTRSSSSYTEEFEEQRWGAMMLLGSSYEESRWSGHSEARAIKWFKACKDFRPSQFECAAHLIRMYSKGGLFHESLREAHALSRTEVEARIMLNTVGGAQCVLPAVLVEVFAKDLAAKVDAGLRGLSPYALYIAGLVSMVRTEPVCTDEHKLQVRHVLGERGKVSIHRALQADGRDRDVKFAEDGVAFDASGGFSLCEDKAVLEFLTSQKIAVHPCQTLRALHKGQCADYNWILSGPGEDKQVEQVGEYIGAASVVDLLHHVYLGNGVRVMRANRRYRVLFAEYFSPRMVANLVSFSLQRMNAKIHIVVATRSQDLIESLTHTISMCGSIVGKESIVMETHIVNDLTAWLGEMADSFWAEGQAHAEHFDYIEYNGGLSLSPSPHEDLKHFMDLLTPDGVIGATYFAETVHQAALDALVDGQNASANPAFSSTPSHLIKGYLHHHGLGHFATDRPLIDFFSQQVDEEGKGSRRRTVYLKSKAVELVKGAGFEVLSTFPAPLTAPYTDELSTFHDVSRHKAQGVDEDAFLRYFSPSFRHTLYLQPRLQGQEGKRAKPEAVTKAVGGDVSVVDRQGTLSRIFHDTVLEHALNNGAPLVYSTTLPTQLGFNFTYTLPSSITPALGKLSHTPTVNSLFLMCKDYWRRKGGPGQSLYSEERIQEDLMSFLSFLETVGSVSLLHNLVPEDSLGLPDHTYLDTRPSASLPREVQSTPVPPQDELSEGRGKGEVQMSAATEEVAVSEDLGDVASSLSRLEMMSKEAKEKLQSLESLKEQLEKASLPPSDASPSTTSSIPAPPLQIPLRRQTLKELNEGPRQPACIGEAFIWSNDFCLADVRLAEQGIPERFSAKVDYVCTSKIAFDEAQFRHLASKKPQLTEAVQEDVLPSLKKVRDVVESLLDTPLGAGEDVCVSLDYKGMDRIKGYQNRAIFLPREPMLSKTEPLCHSEAAMEVKRALAALRSTHDFVAIEVLLKPKAVSSMSSTLLMSNIFYDQTDGNTFVAHHDDGLAFDVFERLAMELRQLVATSLADSEMITRAPRVSVSKYYVTSSDLAKSGSGPVSLGKPGQIAALLWLSPAPDLLLHKDKIILESNTDGLHIFSKQVYKDLTAEGVILDPSQHRDFLTKDGSFSFSLPPVSHYGAQVNRASNRLVMIRGGLPFALYTSGQAGESFETSTVQAFVTFLDVTYD